MQLSEQPFQTPFPPPFPSLLPPPRPSPASPRCCGGRQHPSRKVIYRGKALRTDRLRVRKPAQESQSGATEESENPAVTPSCVPELARCGAGGGTQPTRWDGLRCWALGGCGCHPQGLPWVAPGVTALDKRGDELGLRVWCLETSALSRGGVGWGDVKYCWKVL